MKFTFRLIGEGCVPVLEAHDRVDYQNTILLPSFVKFEKDSDNCNAMYIGLTDDFDESVKVLLEFAADEKLEVTINGDFDVAKHYTGVASNAFKILVALQKVC